METMEELLEQRASREALICELRRRDGDTCQYPGANHKLDFSVTEGNQQVTIDHWFGQAWAYANGWTYEQVWDLSNLKLMCKGHNAKKGSRVPNEDGTLPERTRKTFRYRRQKRANRPEVCDSCNSGRNLGPDEICAACGSGPMPHRWPRWAKVPSKECLHDGTFWCWACASGVIERPSATEMILINGEGGDEDESLSEMSDNEESL